MLILHRYAGLAMAAFLIVAGATGSIIAFSHELDEWLNPQLFHAESVGPRLSVAELARRVEAHDPRARATYIPLQDEPGHAAWIWVDARVDTATGAYYDLGFDQVFVDPVSGAILGTRLWGACCVERENIIAFLYEFHHTLALPEPWGRWVMGGVAVLWVIDCFVGAYLTFPRARPFFAKWRVAWRIKRGAGPYRTNLDVHRAGALWLWAALLLMAVSGVALNLYGEIFKPVVSVFSPITESVWDMREERAPDAQVEPNLTLEEALALGIAEGRARGWEGEASGVFYSPSLGIYGVGIGEEHAAGLGSPWVYLDDMDGRVLEVWDPIAGTAGDVFNALQFPLHSGLVAGLMGRIFISVLGVVVIALAVTGVVIWNYKRRTDRAAQHAVRPAAALRTDQARAR